MYFYRAIPQKNKTLVLEKHIAKKGIPIKKGVDYYAFGAPMPGRTYNATAYRHGFNGQLKDDEISVDGGSYDFGDRMYNSRLGRFQTLDKYSRKYPSETNYGFASNNPISGIDINGDSTYLVLYGAGYMNCYWRNEHNVGNGFKLNAEALKKKIESSSSFDPNRDEVVLVYAPSTSRFTAATNKAYKSGKIASITVFSHGYDVSSTNGTNTGGVSLGGETAGDVRPDGTKATTAEADAQWGDYDQREINGNTISQIDKTNLEKNVRITLYGCGLGGQTKWTDTQIRKFAFGQRLADQLGATVKAFTGTGLFKTDASGKPIYDGEMIRAEDKKTQKTQTTTFTPGKAPVIIK